MTLKAREPRASAPPVPKGEPEGGARYRAWRPGGQTVEKSALLGIWLAVIVIFSFAAPATFPTAANAQSILATQTVLAIMAVAAVIPLVVDQLDLSLAANVGFCALMDAALMSEFGLGAVPAALIAVALGATIGAVNGIVVSMLGVNAIITTLGTASVIAGGMLWYSGGEVVSTGISRAQQDFGLMRVLGIPGVFLVLIVCAAVVTYILQGTPRGKAMLALGTNPRAARLVGLRTRGLIFTSFVMAGAVAGIGGVCQVTVSAVGDPQFGPNLLLPGLSAVFLGATTYRPGQYNVPGTLIAVGFLATSTSGLSLIGAPAYVEPIYYGSALVLSVSASTYVRRRRAGTDL